jgi:hypothetical protein
MRDMIHDDFGEDSIGVAILHEDSAMRFAGLDTDNYGKISLLTQQIHQIIHERSILVNGELSVTLDSAISRTKLTDHSRFPDETYFRGLL